MRCMRKVQIITILIIAVLGSNLPFLLYSAIASIGDSGKIYLFENLLLTGKRHASISLYDVYDPKKPVWLSKISLDTVDFAICDSYLYADNKNDLVIFDISDRRNPRQKAILEDVFLPVVDNYTIACAPPPLACASYESGDSYSGEGGSMARFTLVNKHLYTVREDVLRIFDLQDGVHPQEMAELHVPWRIETVYPHDARHLFLGGREGMYIYNISDPGAPFLVSKFEHAQSCDPVVTSGNRAYITLRAGTICGHSFNQLSIVDISDLTKPFLLSEFSRLEQPYGLDVDGSYAYVCDGPVGLKQLNIENPNDIVVSSIIKGIKPYDVIKKDDFLFISAQNGVYIYQMIDDITPEFVSFIDPA